MADADQANRASMPSDLHLLGLDSSQLARYVQFGQTQLLRDNVLRANAEAMSGRPANPRSPPETSTFDLHPARSGHISGAHALTPAKDLHWHTELPLSVGWMPLDQKRINGLFESSKEAFFNTDSLTRAQIELLAREQAQNDAPDLATGNKQASVSSTTNFSSLG